MMPTDPSLIPSFGTVLESGEPAYDPTSVYDQKGLSAPRGFSAQAPSEAIDPFSGNLIIRHTDLTLPGVAGLDLRLQRVYNSKIHRNYAAKASGDPIRVANGMLFVPPSPLGLGWNLHMGRLVGAVDAGPNSALAGPRYYESSDGSQNPFFTFSGSGCGNGTTDVCLLTKKGDNPYRTTITDTWRMATAGGLNITFGHEAFDGSTIVHYATEIWDPHGNRIQISYHDDTIPGIAVQSEVFRHFIDVIIDSANRQIDFNYGVVNQPDVVRLTSISAFGRTYAYGYSATNPWPAGYSFLTLAQPPEGAPWRYEYDGLNDGNCSQNDRRWCELTKISYPTGGNITYTFEDLLFFAQTNPMAVRAVTERQVAGRAIPVTPAMTYTYNRAADYTGDDHTIITRADGSQELFTYFGVGNGPYNPLGLAWKAGVLLQKRILDSNSVLLQTETFDWQPSQAISQEIWGDPWIGFDVGVFVPRLHQQTIQRGDLAWITNNTTFNSINQTPRCTTEISSDGTERHRIIAYFVPDLIQQGDLAFQFRNLPQFEVLSYDPFTDVQCDDQQSSVVNVDAVDEFGNFTYDVLGRLSVENKNGLLTNFDYNVDGTLQDSSAGGYCTVYSDYFAGVSRQVEYGAPAPGCVGGLYTVSRTVNPDGSVATQTNGRGFTTAFSYDDLGRAILITPPPQSGETAIVISYDGGPTAFNTNKIVTQGGYWLETRLDGLGRELGKETVSGVQLRQEYDAFGRIGFQSLPSYVPNSQVGDTFTYDALGRIESVTHADNSVTSYTYSATEHTVVRVDEQARQTVQTRRAFGLPENDWLVRVQLPGEPTPAEDTYTYLVGGHLSSVLYAGVDRAIGHNIAKQVRVEADPESGSIYYGYDPAGNLRCRERISSTKCSDSNWTNPPAEIIYNVDGVGRVTNIDYLDLDMTDVVMTYDEASNLVTMVDGAGSHRFDYTATDRLAQQVSIVDGVTYTTTHDYDSQGNLETLTYPSGRVVTYGYDADNRANSVAGFVSNVTYHPTGLANEISYGNGIVTTLSLDTRQRADQLQAPGVLDLNYDYNAVGNLDQLVDGLNPSNNTSFQYDSLDRLEDASGPWGSLYYEYNDNGDRTLERLDGQDTVYTYDGDGQLQNLSGRLNMEFEYDIFDNVKRRGELNYVYDSEYRLVEVRDEQNLLMVNYSYDGKSRRVLATRPECPSNLVYHYDHAGNRIAESTGSGLLLTEYIVAGRRSIAEIDLAPLRVDTAELDFGDVGLGLSPITVTAHITLTNRSTDPLSIDSLVLTDSSFSIGAGTPLVVPANGTLAVPVNFSPPTLGAYEGKLSLCAAGGIQIDVELRGTAVQTPTGPNSHAFPPDGRICIVYEQAVDPATVDPLSFAVYGLQTGLLAGDLAVNGSEICMTPGSSSADGREGANGAFLRGGEVLYTSATTRTLFLGGGGPDKPTVWQVQVATSGDDGLFQDSGQEPGESAGERVVLGDLDGDGDLDAYLLSEVAPNEVWLNDGAGNLSDSGQRLGPASGLHSSAVVLGDLDSDGDLDAFVANYGFVNGSRYNTVWQNNGAGLFTDTGQTLGNAESRAVAIADLDGDGDLDAFVANGDAIFIAGYLPRNQIWLNDGNGSFTAGQILGNSRSLDVSLGDVDRDGDLDALVANNGNGDENKLWLNKGDATFLSGQTFGRRDRDVEIGDLNGDGHLDAFLGRTAWMNDGQGLFTLYWEPGIVSTWRAALGDVDGDGDLDLYVLDASGDDQVWLNDGAGSFNDSGQRLSTGPTDDIALGDLDGDGDLDTFISEEIFGEPANNQVWINGEFVPPVGYSVYLPAVIKPE
jgi:YD repeat-containing protein